jgi:hypothetical protein
MIPISASFTHRAMTALSVVGERPGAPENRKNSAMNSAPAASPARPRQAGLFGETIGDKNAERGLEQIVVEGPGNCVTKSGANQRAVKSCQLGIA